MNLERFLEDNKLNYTVGKSPAGIMVNGEFQQSPKDFITYREDTNKLFSAVGKRYEIIQNNEAFDFLTELIEEETLTLENCFIVDGGAKVLIQAALPEYLTLQNGDEIKKYLTIVNSHDGSTTSKIIITPKRLVCQNQLAMFMRTKQKSSFTIRHTKNYRDRLNMATEMLGLTNHLYSIVENELNNLLDIPMSDKQLDLNLKKLYFDSEEIKKLELGQPYDEVISTRKHNIVEGVRDFYFNGIGQDNIIGNANGFINAVSGFYTRKPGVDYFDLTMGTPSEIIKDSFKLFV
jgi:phage/plasmid-like protein (TIGR03299 family)